MSKERKKAARKTAPAAKSRKKSTRAADPAVAEIAVIEPAAGKTRRGRGKPAADAAVETEARVVDETPVRAEVEELPEDDDRGPMVVTAPESETWASDARPTLRRGRAAAAPRRADDVVAPGAVVEKRSDAIVVRFPPAAPPPFEAPEPRRPEPTPAAAPMRGAAPAARHEAAAPPAARELEGEEFEGERSAAPPVDDRGERRGRGRRGRGRGRGDRDGDRRGGTPQDRAAEQRGDRGERGERGERGGHGERGHRGERPERGDRAERGGRERPQRPEHGRGEERRDASGRQLPAGASRPPLAPRAEGDSPVSAEAAAAEARLSPSQKRRLRRKRRMEQRGPAGGTGTTPESEELISELPEGEAPAGATPQELGDEEGAFEEPMAPAAEAGVEQEEEPRSEAAAGRPAGQRREREDRDGRRRRRRGGRGRWRDRDREFDRDAPTEILDEDLEPPVEGAEPDLAERAEAVVREPDVAAEIDDDEDTEVEAPTGKREMLINVVPLEESRIAVLHEGKLEEIYIERRSSENHVGNIYKGVVTNVEASIQAAFVDFGLGKNGFLHISDLHPRYFPHGGRDTETVGRKTPRRHRPPIQRCLRRGQELIVQITKEGIGTKGPTLTTYLSIPGRFLVMMPGMARLGVSRKVEDENLRYLLRDLVNELELPEGMGFIARTAAVGRSKRELQNDLNYLLRLWRAVDRRLTEQRAPAELYRESDLVVRTIRDVFTDDIARLLVDDAKVAEQARQFLSIFNPRAADLVQEYSEPGPLFHRYGIEAELERLHSRHVPLPSGGSLVIDQTEALVAIDVNSGRYRVEDDAEQTAYKINQEAAEEIPRQLRLRDLGGVIICDFIDMREERHRREIERRLVRNLKQHKERAKVLRMSSFGIIELTRQRQRASLTRSVYQDCTHCRGTGLVKTSESVTLDVIRQIQLAVTRDNVSTIEVGVSPDVAMQIQNRKRGLLHDLETHYRRNIWLRPDPGYGLDQVQIQCFDVRGRPVAHQ